MFTWSAAVSVARESAQREGASKVIAEDARPALAGFAARFVVGPARGWRPAPDRWLVRAKVVDADLSLTVFEGREQTLESTT